MSDTAPLPRSSPSLRIDYARELNSQQLEVVLAPPGPLLVIAGAGSGKTRTLTYRVARLLETGAPPESVLLVTFTNKAAREMLDRVARLAGADAPSVWGGTFHHIGHRLLRRHADRVGYDRSFTILDRDDSADLFTTCLPAKPRGERRPYPGADDLLGILSLSRSTMSDPRKRLERDPGPLAEHAAEILAAFRRYEERKRESGLMDFDDLLDFWRRLLSEHDDLLARYREQFRHLLVDEYQDTNRLQAEILDLLAGRNGNLAAVGDDAQSIYGFRGAHFGNIHGFTDRHPEAKVLMLETNYRSTQEILDLTNAVIALNRRQYPKTLRAHRQSSRERGRRPLLIAAGDEDGQAAVVAERIRAMHRDGLPLREIAVLYRAHHHSMRIQMALTGARIPFVIRSGLRFFEQAHVKDVAAWLRIQVNPRDETSWKRVIRLYPGLGPATADRIWSVLREERDPLTAAVSGAFVDRLPKNSRPRWSAVADVLRSLAGLREPGAMIERILEGGYREYLNETHENAPGRVEDLQELAAFASRYNDLEAFLAELTLLAGPGDEEAARNAAGADAVVLSSVHQAKGLEWRTVFVVWLVDGRFPDARGVREPEGEEEERRLFYVATTRAKDRLILVYPMTAVQRGVGPMSQSESRYLRELPTTVYEKEVFLAPAWGAFRSPRRRSTGDDVSQITPWDE